MKLNKKNTKLQFGDNKIWEIIGNGDTDFVFQFSSPGMKTILQKVKPKSIDTLAEINALYRPGPLEAGLVEKYIAIKTDNFTDETKLNEEERLISVILKNVVGNNHSGLLVFQEDVMILCQNGSGFTLAEADDIRKAMGKKKMEILDSYEPRFIENWKYESFITIDGLGDFLPDHKFNLEDESGTITAKELYEKVQNGEKINIEV